MNLNEAIRLKEELEKLHFKKENGEEIHITFPNPEDKYGGSWLRICKGRLENDSFLVLGSFCKERKLTLKPINGYLAIYRKGDQAERPYSIN